MPYTMPKLTALARLRIWLVTYSGRHAEYLSGSLGVNIGAGAEAFNHILVLGDVGQHPEFDLGVVSVHQGAVPGGIEEFAEHTAHIGAHRDILQVGLGRADASSAGFSLLEDAVYPSVLAHHLDEPVHIGVLELWPACR